MKSTLYAYSAYKFTCHSPVTVGLNLEDLNDMFDEIDDDVLNVVVITVAAQVVFSFQTVDGDKSQNAASHKTFHVAPQNMDAEVFGTPDADYWEDSDLILKMPSEVRCDVERRVRITQVCSRSILLFFFPPATV
jgi:hypothetical protein